MTSNTNGDQFNENPGNQDGDQEEGRRGINAELDRKLDRELDHYAIAEIARLKANGEQDLVSIWSGYREKLDRMIAFRIDPNLRRRFDPADVLQEAFIEISKRLPEFLSDPKVPFFVWIRQQTLQKLIDLHRLHSREKRDATREVHVSFQTASCNTSMSIARMLIDDITSPSLAAVREEESMQLQLALDTMNETDREILALRHFEQLNNSEVADVLQISPTAASNRYVRAAAKLSEILRSVSKSFHI